MIGDLFGGLFGCGIAGGRGPTCPDGAAAQAASRQQYIIRTYFDPATQMERREYWQARLAVSSEELRLQAMRGAQNANPMADHHRDYAAKEAVKEHVDGLRRERWIDTADGMHFVLWVCGLALAALSVVCFRQHW